MPNAYVLTALSDSHEKNAFFAFPSQNAILITEISEKIAAKTTRILRFLISD